MDIVNEKLPVLKFLYLWNGKRISKSFFFSKILSEKTSECQTDWTQIRPDILSGLIWVLSVCKGYHQTTLGCKKLIN